MIKARGPINVILFQVGWWTCLWSASTKSPWIAFAVTVLILAIHLKFIASRAKVEVKALLLTSFLGIGIDFTLLKSGVFWIQLDQGIVDFPVWLGGMWFLFSSSLAHSLAAFQKRPLWAAVAGGIFGPLSYYVGERFEVLHFNEPRIWTFSLFALLWAVIFPAFLWIHSPKENVAARS